MDKAEKEMADVREFNRRLHDYLGFAAVERANLSELIGAMKNERFEAAQRVRLWDHEIEVARHEYDNYARLGMLVREYMLPMSVSTHCDVWERFGECKDEVEEEARMHVRPQETAEGWGGGPKIIDWRIDADRLAAEWSAAHERAREAQHMAETQKRQADEIRGHQMRIEATIEAHKQHWGRDYSEAEFIDPRDETEPKGDER